tara:strand:- start:105 stop:716 length:612 start_codon:yes stop_codon:yes gene_type:complete
MKSLSEIDTVSKRASKAAGFSWGVSEEVGKNVRLLEMFGLSGIKNLNNYYKSRKNKKYEKLILIDTKNIKMKIEFCPIIAGTSFLDQVQSLEKIKEIVFENVAFPILMLPFLSRASEVIGKRLLFKIDEKEFQLNYNYSIYSNLPKNEVIENGRIIIIRFLNNNDSFEKKEWDELYKLSEDTFVEENESLKKSGAGAGLTDND